MSTEEKRAFLINVAYVAVIVFMIYVVAKYLLVWLLPFIIGLVIALILQRPVSWVAQKTKSRRKLIAPIFTFVLVAVIMGLLLLLIYVVGRELVVFVQKLPDWYTNNFPGILAAIQEKFDAVLEPLPGDIGDSVRGAMGSIGNSLAQGFANFSKTAVGWAAVVATRTPAFLISFIITIIACFYISVSIDESKQFIRKFLPARFKKMAASVWNSAGKMVAGVIRSYGLIMCITFAELSIGLTLLRIDYSVLFAAIIAVVDILPVLGVGTVLIPWAVICFIIGNIKLGVGIAVLYVLIAVVRNALEPRLIGSRIGLHPLLTLILLYLGLKALGFIGMFLLPLAALVIKNIHDMGGLDIRPSRGDTGEESPGGGAKPG